jgi:hypothetical protein
VKSGGSNQRHPTMTELGSDSAALERVQAAVGATLNADHAAASSRAVRAASAVAVRCLTPTKLSGVSEIESIPASTRRRAKSGLGRSDRERSALCHPESDRLITARRGHAPRGTS